MMSNGRVQVVTGRKVVQTITISPQTRGGKKVTTEAWFSQSVKNMQSSFIAEGISFSDREAQRLMALVRKEVSA